jgi:hypothetical protein
MHVSTTKTFKHGPSYWSVAGFGKISATKEAPMPTLTTRILVGLSILLWLLAPALFLVMLAWWFLPTRAFADSVTIESGRISTSLRFDWEPGPAARPVGFTGQDFSLSVLSVSLHNFSPPGATVGADVILTQSGFLQSDVQRQSALTYQGITYNVFRGQAEFTSLIQNALPGLNHTTFSFAGFVSPLDPLTNTPLFRLDLDGIGFSSIDYRSVGGGILTPIATSYVFEPIPEPATWLLLGSGVVALLRRIRS